jgi:hypothetical protein
MMAQVVEKGGCSEGSSVGFGRATVEVVAGIELNGAPLTYGLWFLSLKFDQQLAHSYLLYRSGRARAQTDSMGILASRAELRMWTEELWYICTDAMVLDKSQWRSWRNVHTYLNCAY